MTTKLLSICIPTYNRCSLLQQTIEKLLPLVLSNTKKVDIHVFDNGSVDGTKQYMELLVSKNSFVFFHRHANNIGFDRNVMSCVEHSTGEYTAFLGDDDLVPDNYLTKILASIIELRPGVIYLNHCPFFENNIRNRYDEFHPAKDIVYPDYSLFYQNYGLGFISSLVIETASAKEFIETVSIGHGCAHIDIASRIVLKAKKTPFIFLGTVIIAGRNHNGQSYDPLYEGALYPAINRLKLYEENLIDKKILRSQMRLILISSVLPNLVKFKCKLVDKNSFNKRLKELDEVFHHYIWFSLLVFPIKYTPKFFLIFMLRIRKFMKHRCSS